MKYDITSNPAIANAASNPGILHFPSCGGVEVGVGEGEAMGDASGEGEIMGDGDNMGEGLIARVGVGEGVGLIKVSG